MRTRLVPAAAAIAALTLLVTGCGSSGSDSDGKRDGFASQSGRKILDAGFADTENVKTMRIRGTVVEDGQRMKVDVRTDAQGNCAGTMTVGKGTAQIVVTKQAAYIKGDDAFWKDAGGGNADALVNTLNGRWLKSKPDPEISGLCGLGTGMIAEMKSAIPKNGKVHVGAQSRIGDAVVIELNDGGTSDAGSLFISVEAPHYIRRVNAGDQGTLTLSGFGDKKPIKVPSAADSYSVE